MKKLANKLGKNVYFQNCDLRDISGLKLSISKLINMMGSIDVLVNNAARDDRHDWKEVTEDYWDERFPTNLRH